MLHKHQFFTVDDDLPRRGIRIVCIDPDCQETRDIYPVEVFMAQGTQSQVHVIKEGLPEKE